MSTHLFNGTFVKHLNTNFRKDQPYISVNDTNKVKELLNLIVEVCGILQLSNGNKMNIFFDNIGNIEGIRTCSYLRYSKYIWHTHPKSSKGYPSAEDIAKTLKHSDIHEQILFTSWGVWELYASNNKKPSEVTVEKIRKDGDNLYNKTTRGRVLTTDNISSVYSYIARLEHKLSSYGLKIVFTPWWEIDENENYFLKIK